MAGCACDGDRLTGARCTVTRHGHTVSIVNTQNTNIWSIRRMEINPEYRHQTVSQSRVNDAVNGEKIPRIGRVCIQPWHQTFRKTNRWTDADWRSVPAGDLDTDMRFSNNRNFCQKLVFAVKSLAVKHRTRGTWQVRDTWHALPLLTLTWELSRFAKQKQAGPRYWLRSPPRVGPPRWWHHPSPTRVKYTIYIPWCIFSSGVMLMSQTRRNACDEGTKSCKNYPVTRKN